MSKRNHLWDNIKGFLILTVVIGHFLYSFQCDYKLAQILYYWIYTFHMPAFLFASGLFAKKYCINSKVKAEKVLYLFGYLSVFQLVEYSLFHILGSNKEFTVFDPYRGLWYLLSLIIFYLLIPIFEKFKPHFAIPLVVALGLIIGCEKSAGSLLAISRTFTFSPFFFLGYYTTENFTEKIHNFKGKIPIGILSVLISVSLWFFSDVIFPEPLLNQSGEIPQALFYGEKGYTALKYSLFEGLFMRIVAYVIAILMIIGLILLIPKIKTPLSKLGKNSLQIYIFHIMLNITFKTADFFDFIVIDNIIKTAAVIIFSIVASFIFSLKPFSYPFKWIQTGIDKIIYLSKNK